LIGRALTDLARLIEERRSLDEDREQTRSLKAEVERAETGLRAAQRSLQTAEAGRKREIDSLNHRAGLLEQASCSEAEIWEDPKRRIRRSLVSICPLLADAQTASQRRIELEAAEIPERAELTNAKKIHRAALSAYDAARSEAADLDRRIQENDQAQGAARNRIAQQAIIDDARKQIEAIGRELESLEFELDLALENFRSSQDMITAQIAGVAKTAAAASGALENELADLRRQSDKAANRSSRAKAALDTARRMALDVAEMERLLNAGIEEREETESQVRKTEREHSAAASRLEILEARAAELERVRAQIEQINQRLSDLKLIELATGRNGVQVLEISAAGPGISKKINDLLESCYGSRFSVRFETLREKVSSPGEFAEDFDIKISDNGREDSAAGLSGGEQVWIAAAISLGINIYNAERSPIRWETLWLDETAGGLDAENARAYINMLRKARELGRFHQILFVSHSLEVQSMADACLYFSNGEVHLPDLYSLEMPHNGTEMSLAFATN
jgi:DNA repair exonuclease SbcCD ATPase subunit